MDGVLRYHVPCPGRDAPTQATTTAYADTYRTRVGVCNDEYQTRVSYSSSLSVKATLNGYIVMTKSKPILEGDRVTLVGFPARIREEGVQHDKSEDPVSCYTSRLTLETKGSSIGNYDK